MTNPQAPPPTDRYVDPKTGARWKWDGQHWRPDDVPLGSHAPPPPRPAPKAKRSRGGFRSGITVTVLVAVVFAAAGLIYAMARGQDLRSVDPGSGKVEFYSTSGASDGPDSEVIGEIESSQGALTERVDALEAQAELRGDDGVTSGVSDFSGSWLGANGLRYSIRQFGAEAVIEEQSIYGTSAVGEGSIFGDTFEFSFESYDGSFGRGTLSMTDPNFLSGSFVNDFYGTSTPATMQRA